MLLSLSVVALQISCLLSAVSARPRRRFVSPNAEASEPGPGHGPFWPKQTIPYWTDEPLEKRSKWPPYVPPPGWIYNTSGGPIEGKINVHIVPHSHDDTGWIITVDQYFYREVYYIIDTVIDCLLQDPNRKFIYVEVAFFARWWNQQPVWRQDQARGVVKAGQLEFINGGWCMHDEASPDYIEMTDQTTRGHQFLLKNFGKTAIPRGTWQIDPFGHSQTQAWLMGAEAGFESIFWGRTDYQDFNARLNYSTTKKGLEWIWQSSQSLGASAQIFAGEIFGSGSGNYGTWMNFDGDDPQIQDDPTQHDYNVDKWIDQLVQDAREQARHTQTSHQLWAAGGDFNYQNAKHWYHNLDKLIHYSKINGSVNVFYSTPSLYVDSKKASGETWEKRYDDVFPLADAAHHYWTGYFTSRPALKRQVKFATQMLHSARQMEMASGVTAKDVDHPTTRPSPPVGSSWTDSLEGMIGVATHHDAISGTERQPVSNDYAARMSESVCEVEVGIGKSLQKLMGTDADVFHCNCNSAGPKDCLNISMCSFTSTHTSFRVVAWNPRLSFGSKFEQIRLPVVGDKWKVVDESTGLAVPSQVAPLDERTKSVPLLYINYHGLNSSEVSRQIKEHTNPATHMLTFGANSSLVGYRSFLVTAGADERAPSPKAAAAAAASVELKKVDRSDPPFTVSNGIYELTFDPATGMTTTIRNLRSGKATPLAVTWGWYLSSTGGCTDAGCDSQPSGAYIFRPNNTIPFMPGGKEIPTLQVVKGPVVTEVYQKFSNWTTHVIRLVQGQPYVEVEWTAGPIPDDNPSLLMGKEVIIRYESGLKTGGTFYTDASSREMVRRDYNKRGASYPTLEVSEPVAGNYYPITGMLAIEDTAQDLQMAVLTDVTQGGGSLVDGEMQLMVHRRLLADDFRGVGLPLNETMCGCNAAVKSLDGPLPDGDDTGCWCGGLTVRGRHWLVFDQIEAANRDRRALLESLHSQMTLAFMDGSAKVSKPLFTSVANALPSNVRLQTLTNNYADINDGQALIRFAHLYSVGEHPELSKPANFSLVDIFATENLKIKTAKAMSLTANQMIEEMDAKKFAWKVEDITGGKVDAEINAKGKPWEKRFPFDPKDPKLTVTLRPMEVRTFLVTFATSTPSFPVAASAAGQKGKQEEYKEFMV